MNVNPYAASAGVDASPRSKTRFGIVPATISAFFGIVVLVIAVVHFLDVVVAEIGRAVSGGQFARAIGCVFATTLLIACAATLLVASRAWMRHELRDALFFTFVAPSALVFLALFFFYGFG